jgi:hypothetical protein
MNEDMLGEPSGPFYENNGFVNKPANHVEYVRSLGLPALELIVKRDVECRGSWESMLKRALPSQLTDIKALQEYERFHAVNLAPYVAELRRMHKIA